MSGVHPAISDLESLCGRDLQQRNIGPLAAHVRGSLARAAASIARHPRPSVAIITGFYLPDGVPPNCETDGPPGAAMIAAGLSAAGVPCRLVTDQVNAGVVAATAAATGLDLPVDVAAMRDDHDAGGARLADIERAWRVGAPPISHVIAIERCGPSRDGRPRNADGEDITAVNAPLDRLFAGGPWTTIGIGDLGNELGMGSLPYELVAASVARGGELWCRVACDHPIVAGVSNLAAAALLGALALQRPGWSAAMLDWLTPDCAGRLLAAAVRDGGAVASQRGDVPRPLLAVDGLPWAALETEFGEIERACRRGLARGSHA